MFTRIYFCVCVFIYALVWHCVDSKATITFYCIFRQLPVCSSLPLPPPVSPSPSSLFSVILKGLTLLAPWWLLFHFILIKILRAFFNIPVWYYFNNLAPYLLPLCACVYLFLCVFLFPLLYAHTAFVHNRAAYNKRDEYGRVLDFVRICVHNNDRCNHNYLNAWSLLCNDCGFSVGLQLGCSAVILLLCAQQLSTEKRHWFCDASGLGRALNMNAVVTAKLPGSLSHFCISFHDPRQLIATPVVQAEIRASANACWAFPVSNYSERLCHLVTDSGLWSPKYHVFPSCYIIVLHF